MMISYKGLSENNWAELNSKEMQLIRNNLESLDKQN